MRGPVFSYCQAKLRYYPVDEEAFQLGVIVDCTNSMNFCPKSGRMIDDLLVGLLRILSLREIYMSDYFTG